MLRWKTEVPNFLDEACRWDGRGDFIGQAKCTSCYIFEACFRCNDCFNHGLLCQTCIVNQHHGRPLHIVEYWDAQLGFFHRVSLKSLGLTLQLGHSDSSPCFMSQPTKSFIILHSNGIHEVQVNFCGCNGALGHVAQLMRQRLYPATVDQPNTTATFACLDEGLAHSYSSQETSYEYYKVLENLTDNTGLKNLWSRQDELRRMMRQWRWLLMLKRAGRAHDPEGVDKTALGACAVICPACPQVGINLPNGWDTLEQEDGWIYRLFVGNDADFKIKRRDVSSEEKDPGLCQGHAYFVEQRSYDTYLERNKGVKQPPSKCVSHDAVNRADRKEVHGLKVTGLATVDCTRHEMKRPNGIAALQQGERHVSNASSYLNIDFIVWMSLWMTLLNWIVMSYDIMCQYSINFYKRMEAQFPDKPSRIRTKEVRFTWTVPKFHLPAHVQSCWQSFNFNYTRWTGRSDEAVERGWSWLNRLGRSIKEMGPGSWQDTIEDHIGFHNWQKVTGMGESLLRKLHQAVPRAQAAAVELAETELGILPETLHQWKKEVKVYEEDNTTPNPYAPRARPPTMEAVQLTLLEEEAESLQNDLGLVCSDISPSSMIKMGLDFEEQQEEATALGPHATAQQRGLVQGRANSLQRKIVSWFNVQVLYIPGANLLRTHDQEQKGAMDNKMFDMGLWLPSNIGRQIFCSSDLQEFEWKLRTAQANDALDAVRTCLRLKGYLFRERRTNVSGVSANTRSQKAVANAQQKILRFQKRYNVAFQALASLAPLLEKDPTWKLFFRPLVDEDVQPLPADRLTGEKDISLSWIWKMPGVADTDDAAVHDEIRLQWLRARARANRWSEELLLLIEEMRRVLETFSWQANWWKQQQNRRNVEPSLSEGLNAYAKRQAALKEELSRRFQYLWRFNSLWLASGKVPTQRRWFDEIVKPRDAQPTVFDGIL
ncbi:hypothetical protein C8J56DRAFT_793853 [Mycena floridula]|nr:hypothetical protein C8J56DRAFT_793853 [Mycena floridula]